MPVNMVNVQTDTVGMIVFLPALGVAFRWTDRTMRI